MSAPTLFKVVCNAMERIAPLRLAEKWDNVGTLLESPVPKPDRRKVLLTIDLTPAVLEESLSKQVSVIVSYHPPIFKPLQSFTLSDPLQTSLLRCAAEGISVYSPHSSIDSVWGGVNDWLAEGVLGETGDRSRGTVRALVSEKISPTSGESEGAEGRLVLFDEPVSFSALQNRIKKLFYIQVGLGLGLSSSDPVRTVAICAGSGGSMLLGKDADVYFTGEMSHHEVLAAIAARKHVVLCGHTNTERGYLPILAGKLRQELGPEGEAEVLVSDADKHPLDIV
ncbi:NGG1p interacting factor 3 [Marasmius fiardii PR-910]|nr:NGG1p interacting factor 3 [Marasmius fiardii PR-910]